jgi:Leucine-rich repeat (LRR) protein
MKLKTLAWIALVVLISGCSKIEHPTDSSTSLDEGIGVEDVDTEVNGGNKREFIGEDYAINWTDEGFEAIARDFLKKTTGDIYASELIEIDYISLDKEFEHLPTIWLGFKSGSYDERGIAEYSRHQSLLTGDNIWKIESFDDLQHFISLTKLSLCGFIVGDMSYLKNVPQLESLVLIGCQNMESNYSEHHLDLASVTYLENLSYLHLQHNGVKDLSPLSELHSLRVLEIKSEKINDYSTVSTLVNLEYLDFDDNKVTDISFISNLTNLKDLKLWTDSVDVSHLANMADLMNLRISCNAIYNLDVLGNNLKIERFNLWLVNATDISVIDVNVLKELPALSSVSISIHKHGGHSNITDNEISAMNEIILSVCDIQNLKSLHLNLSGGLDFSPIGGLAGLTELSIERAGISDIEFISSLVNLTHLGLAWNSISDISPLRNLGKLERLNLDANYDIVDISPLSELRSLTHLNMLNNSIENWTPVEHIEKVDGRR